MTTLEEACVAIVDCEHKTAPIDPAGDCYAVGTPAMRGNRINYDQARRISRETLLAWTRRLTPRPGDLLFAREAPVGPIVSIPDTADVAPGQRTVLLRPDPSILDSGFAYYLLSSPLQQARLLERAEGSTVPHLNVADVRSFELPSLPPVREQRSIAATLGALDDKIESNRHAAEIELELAAALLVGGTETIRVGDIADVDKGLSYKGAGLDDGSASDAIPMVNLANFTTSGAVKPEGRKYYTGDFKPKHRLAAWDLVVANTDLTQSREILGRGFLVPSTLQGALHTHHTSVVRFRERSELAPFLWARLQSPEFRDRAKGFATGTTVTALPREALLDYEFSVPSNPELSLAAARGLIEHSWQLAAESAAVTRTRDALLPELLSGRIRVPEAAAVVQDGTE